MSELNVEIDLAKCLTQHGFVLHMNEIFQFPGDFWNAVSVVDSGMQDLGWIAEQRVDITQINLNKAKKKSNDGPNHGLKWAMDRFDMYQRYWDRPGRKKSFHVACRG